MKIIEISKERDYALLYENYRITQVSLSKKAEELGVSVDDLINILVQRENRNARGYERSWKT